MNNFFSNKYHHGNVTTILKINYLDSSTTYINCQQKIVKLLTFGEESRRLSRPAAKYKTSPKWGLQKLNLTFTGYLAP